MATPLLASPAPRRRRRLGLLALALAAAALCWASQQLAHDYRFRVQQVVVEHQGSELPEQGRADWRPHCTPAELRHLADVRQGTPIWSVNLDQVVAGVMRHPWVASVEASRRWPDTVVIRVGEHRPAMLLKQGGLYYVDEAGEVFKRARGSDLDHPVLTGVDAELSREDPRLARRVVLEALDILAQVDTSTELLVSDISEIHFHLQDGFTLVLRGGTELALGFASVERRLPRLARLRSEGLDPSVPQRIDLAPDTVALVAPLPPTTPGLD